MYTINICCLGLTSEKVSARFSHHYTRFRHHHVVQIILFIITCKMKFVNVFAHELLPKLQVVKFTLITHNMTMHQPQSKGWHLF